MTAILGKYADGVVVPVKVASDGAVLVDSNDALEIVSIKPRSAVTPQVSAANKSFHRFGDASATIYYFRITVNSGDNIAAATRLSNMQNGVFMLRPGESLLINTDSAVTRLDVVAVGSAESATLSSGEVVVEDTATSTVADYQTAMMTFNFESSDNVRGVTLSASDRQGNDVTVHVDGRAY